MANKSDGSPQPSGVGEVTTVCTGFKGKQEIGEWKCERCGQYSQCGCKENTRIGDRRRCTSCVETKPPPKEEARG
jgi:hypothetical protein